MKRPSKKLDHKKISPYPIKKLVDLSYWLKLPTLMQIPDVFYSNLLELAAENPLHGQINDFLPFIVVNSEGKCVKNR